MARRLGMALAAAATVAALLLAGCSSAPSAAPAATSAPAVYSVTAQQPVVRATTTDVMHLLDRPTMSPKAPTAQDPLRLHVRSIFEGTVDPVHGFTDSWDMTLPRSVQAFAGNATLLVEVTGGLVGDPRADLQGGGCFWFLGVTAGSYETGQLYDLGCVKQLTQVPAGLYQLSFPFTLTGIAWDAGTPLHFELHTGENTPRSPSSDAVLLTGSVAQDSTIRIYGLQVPLEPTLLSYTSPVG